MKRTDSRGDAATRQLRVRLSYRERDAFEQAARLSGLSLSAWVRMASREMATRQLVGAGKAVSWLS